MEEAANTIILLVLGMHAQMDVRKRQISLALTAVFAGLGIGFHFAVGTFCLAEFLLAMIPGGLLVVTGFITQGKVGYGDGLLLLSLGSWMNVEEILWLLVTALLFCSAFCGIRMAAGKLKKQDSVPFVPFLLVCFAGRLCL
ncbi:MAG: prepilin peptidase [Fusicatenibacter sp.]|nr:prepilin peptidase [Fusicatenibacter sp.]